MISDLKPGDVVRTVDVPVGASVKRLPNRDALSRWEIIETPYVQPRVGSRITTEQVERLPVGSVYHATTTDGVRVVTTTVDGSVSISPKGGGVYCYTSQIPAWITLDKSLSMVLVWLGDDQ